MIDYRTISAVIQLLPEDKEWAADERERWLRAMTSVVDFLIAVKGPRQEPK